MKKIVSHMHVSLDGFAATEDGKMNWIKVDGEVFEYGKSLIDNADTALYGRVTWEMMDNYWPTAADKPNASKHDKEHSAWYKSAEKFAFSNSLKGQKKNDTTFLGGDVVNEVRKLKQGDGKNIMIFGSPSVTRLLMKEDLIDEYWLNINPIILGKGISMFASIESKIELQLKTTKVFSCGVVSLQYVK